MRNLLASLVVLAAIVVASPQASAECNCLAIAGEVGGKVQAAVARADSLYLRADYDGALALYADAYAASREPVLLYAQGMCQWQLGAGAEAAAMFRAYVDADSGGAFAARATAALDELDDGGVVGGVVGGVDDTVDGTVGTGVGVVGGVTGKAPKPKKLAKGAAIVLGVVAVVAIGAVAVQGISASMKDDVDFDKRFGLGMGVSGAVVGGTAIYLWGLTAATGAVGATCVTDNSPAAMPRAYGASASFAF